VGRQEAWPGLDPGFLLHKMSVCLTRRTKQKIAPQIKSRPHPTPPPSHPTHHSEMRPWGRGGGDQKEIRKWDPLQVAAISVQRSKKVGHFSKFWKLILTVFAKKACMCSRWQIICRSKNCEGGVKKYYLGMDLSQNESKIVANSQPSND
jgi:hypothetical protein